ncbi:MAG TPA: phosphate ABC transporter permease PstA [Planctomycetota bacterium]|jgi:phosphate transport system permease protein|nr:phosphate ABC transporter permease PstA [Planctomycetota bacterium]
MPEQLRLLQLSIGLVWLAAGLTFGLFAWIVGDLLVSGWSSLSLDFFLQAPADAGRQGGIASIVLSTLLILLVCMGTALPLAMLTALFLSEFTRNASPLGRGIRTSLDILTGVPSIAFGLFGNAFFCRTLGMGFSILSGGLTLACMVLPILVRTLEIGFRSVPQEYRAAAAALGLSKAATIRSVVLPTSATAAVAGLTLGLGRAIAETAALIFTSGYVDRSPTSLMDSGRSLSVHIYDLSMNVPGGADRAYASALVLVVILLVLHVVAARGTRFWFQRMDSGL